jgi:hypothetical protein
MKKFLCFLLLSTASIYGQTVQSTCEAHDSIVNKYREDGDRLALRNSYTNNSTFRDSIKIDKILSKSYRDALIAVYNATLLPARDSVVNLFNIHTRPDPEMHKVHINGDPAYQWMMNVKNNIFPTGDPSVDNLMSKYSLTIDNYYQGQGYDLVIFRTDSNLNMKALANSFTVIAGVMSSTPGATGGPGNIKDSISNGSTFLTYSYMVGCGGECYRYLTWRFKTATDCSVQYLGSTSVKIIAGVNNYRIDRVVIFPNPVSNQFSITKSSLIKYDYELKNMHGQLILQGNSNELNNQIDVSYLPAGLYFLTIKDGQQLQRIKLIKN